MRFALTRAALFLLAAGGLTVPALAQEPTEPRPQIVLRIARPFLVELTSVQFRRAEPIDTTALGASVQGTAFIHGRFGVKLHKSETESAFDLLVDGLVETRSAATRRPVVVHTHGTAPFQARRRVVFKQLSFDPRAVAVDACYHSSLDRVCSFRGGLTGALVRRVARPIAERSLPEGDRIAGQEIRGQLAESVTQESDKLITVLNEAGDTIEDLLALLRSADLLPQEKLLGVGSTDEYLFAGLGFAGARPELPEAAGPARAPVELWINHTKPQRERRFAEALDDWHRVKPFVLLALWQTSPRYARLLENIRAEVLPEQRQWHVIRFERPAFDRLFVLRDRLFQQQ